MRDATEASHATPWWGLREMPLLLARTKYWSSLVKDKSKFTAISTEALFGCFDRQKHPELQSWYDYITERYAWVLE
jgi:hypothetical protein